MVPILRVGMARLVGMAVFGLILMLLECALCASVDAVFPGLSMTLFCSVLLVLCLLVCHAHFLSTITFVSCLF